jgi:hypothetical protein
MKKITVFWDITLHSVVDRSAVSMSKKKEKAKHGKNGTEKGRTRTLNKPI